MSQDLKEIKKQLKTFEEVESIYDIKIGQHVKYVTINNGDEYFYEGGPYIKMGDNKMILKVGNKYEHIPLIHHNKDGFIFYRTRLFVDGPEKVMDGGGDNTKTSSKEYEKVIKTQQQIIEKMNLQLKKQNEYILKLQGGD